MSGVYGIYITQHCYAANREQPQIENSNEMPNIHCAISVFMAKVHTTLAETMNICKALAGAMKMVSIYVCGAADEQLTCAA